jgi:transcriptional antiterminator Rof (Rho-off)
VSDYHSISCDLHSRYELAILHRERWRVDGVSNRGEERELAGRPVDLITRSGEEFLRFEADSGELLELRLDRVRRVEKDGKTA